MASPADQQRAAGLAAAQHASKSGAQQRRAEGLAAAQNGGRTPNRHGGGILGGGLFGHLVGQTLTDFKDAAVNMPAGLYQVGKAQALDLNDLLAHGDFTPERTGGILKAMGLGTVHDLEHPLRHPGNTALDVLGLLSAGAGTAARAGAVGKLLAEGGTAGDITNAVLHSPKPPPRVLSLGDLHVKSPGSRSPLWRAAKSATDKRLMRKAAEEPGGRAYHRLNAKISKEVGRNAHVIDSLERGHYAALDALGKKLSPAQQESLRVVADGLPIEDVTRFHEQRLNALHNVDTPEARLEIKRHRTVLKRLHQAGERYVRTVDGKPVFRDSANTKVGHLNDVYAKASKAAGTREKLLEYLGFLDPAGAELRKAMPARVMKGAQWVEPTPARLGRGVSAEQLDRQGKLVERLTKLDAKATARAEARAAGGEARTAKALVEPGMPGGTVTKVTSAEAVPRTSQAIADRVAQLEKELQPMFDAHRKSYKQDVIDTGGKSSFKGQSAGFVPASSWGEMEWKADWARAYNKKHGLEHGGPGAKTWADAPEPWKDTTHTLKHGGDLRAEADQALVKRLVKVARGKGEGAKLARLRLAQIAERDSLHGLEAKNAGADLFPEDVPAAGRGVDLKVVKETLDVPGRQSRYRRALAEAGFSENEIAAGLKAASDNLGLYKSDPAAFVREVGQAATGKQLELKQAADAGPRSRVLSIEEANNLTPDEAKGLVFHGTSAGNAASIAKSGVLHEGTWFVDDAKYAAEHAGKKGDGKVVAVPRDSIPAGGEEFKSAGATVFAIPNEMAFEQKVAMSAGTAKRLSGRAAQFGKIVEASIDQLPAVQRGGLPMSPTVTRIRGALSVAKDQLERNQARVDSQITPTGLVGHEDVTNPDGIFISGARKQGPLGNIRVAAKGAIGFPKQPPSFEKIYTGSSKLHALEPENVLQAIAHAGLEAQRYGAMLTFRDLIARAGVTAPPAGDIAKFRFLRFDDAGRLSPVVSDLLDKSARGEKLSPAETAEVSGKLEALRSHIFTDPNGLDHDQMQQLHQLALDGKGVWVSEKLVGSFDKQAMKLTNLIGQRPTSLIDSVNNAEKAAVLYLKPAYAIPNMLGNAALNILQQGFAAPANLARAVLMKHALGPELTARVDSFMGEGFARAISSDSGLWNHAIQKAADLWSAGVDIPFRRSAFMHEARRAGFSSHDQLERLLTKPEHQDELVEIVRRANNEIIDYSELSNVEREVVRRVIFFYPWVKGATRYAGTLLTEHPIKAAAIGQLSQQGKQYAADTLGPTPSYLEGSFGVGKNQLVNPQAAAILNTPAQVGQALAALAAGHAPETGDLSNFMTPALSLALNEISRRNLRLGADYPRSATGAGIAYDTLIKGLPQMTLATRIRDALAGKNQDKLFPPTVPGAVGQFVIGGVAPRKVNRAKLLALYRKEQTLLKK